MPKYYCSNPLFNQPEYLSYSNKDLLKFIRVNHFSPNALWHTDNPVLHCWLANEWFDEIRCLLILIPDRINPNLRDGKKFGCKSLLILLTMLPSSNSLPFEFIDKYKLSLHFDDQDLQGKTALHYAVILGRHDLVNHLISHGASSLVQDKDGMTPFDYLNCQEDIIRNVLKMVGFQPSRDVNALKDYLTDDEDHVILIQGRKIFQTKDAIDTLLANEHLVLIKYIEGREPNWGTFIGDASEETRDHLLDFAQEIASEHQVALSDVFVEQPMDEAYQVKFRAMLTHYSSTFSGHSVMERCLAGHEIILKARQEHVASQWMHR